MTDMVQVTINNEREVIYGISNGICLHLALAYSKGEGQGRAHFDNEDLGNGDR